MAASIVLSQSRAGTISLICELAFLFFIASRNKRRTVMRNSLLLLVFAVLLFVVWIGSAAMWHHLSDLQPGMRAAVAKDSLKMLLRRPILGWGLGTFSTAYPAYQSFFTDVFTNAAHNDYLQVLIETGGLGFACLVWFIVALYRRGLKRVHNWTECWSGALSTAALVGCTGLLVHSAFDFNLQIPANAAVFYVLCALATNVPGTRVKRVALA
jgi:O-antigen ligase